jgi:hypothetical protein
MSQTATPPNYQPQSFQGLTAQLKPLKVSGFRYPVFEAVISDQGPVVDRFEVFKDAIGWVVWNAGWASEKTVSARSEYAASLPAFVADGLPAYTVAYA